MCGGKGSMEGKERQTVMVWREGMYTDKPH